MTNATNNAGKVDMEKAIDEAACEIADKYVLMNGVPRGRYMDLRFILRKHLLPLEAAEGEQQGPIEGVRLWDIGQEGQPGGPAGSVWLSFVDDKTVLAINHGYDELEEDSIDSPTFEKVECTTHPDAAWAYAEPVRSAVIKARDEYRSAHPVKPVEGEPGKPCEPDPHDPLGDGSVTLWNSEPSWAERREDPCLIRVDGRIAGGITREGEHDLGMDHVGKFPRKVWNPAHRSFDFAALRDRIRQSREAAQQPVQVEAKREGVPKEMQLRIVMGVWQQFIGGEWRDVACIRGSGGVA